MGSCAHLRWALTFRTQLAVSWSEMGTTGILSSFLCDLSSSVRQAQACLPGGDAISVTRSVYDFSETTLRAGTLSFPLHSDANPGKEDFISTCEEINSTS